MPDLPRCTVLRRLLREEVDPNATVRNKLVSALLLGANVTVRKGSDGADLQPFGHLRVGRSCGHAKTIRHRNANNCAKVGRVPIVAASQVAR